MALSTPWPPAYNDKPVTTLAPVAGDSLAANPAVGARLARGVLRRPMAGRYFAGDHRALGGEDDGEVALNAGRPTMT